MSNQTPPNAKADRPMDRRVYCYHCHSNVKLVDSFFSCPTPECSNKLLSLSDISTQFLGPDAPNFSSVESFLNVRCPMHGRRLIPYCGNRLCRQPLHFSISVHNAPVLAVVAGSRAGKTCYLGALRKRLLDNSRLNVAFFPARGARYVEDIFRSLCWERNLPPRDGLVDVQKLVPCAIRISVHQQQNRAESRCAVTYNVAGEAFSPPDDDVLDDSAYVSSMERYARYIGGPMTSGILLMVDPYACSQIDRERLAAQPTAQTQSHSSLLNKDFAPEEILRMVTTYLSMNHQDNLSGKLPISLAIVLAKLDVFLNTTETSPSVLKAAQDYVEADKAAYGGIIDNFLRQANALDLHCRTLHQAALKLFQQLNLDNLFREASENFSSVRCFAMSSLGHTPQSERLSTPFEPVGVDAPFLWLFQNSMHHDARPEV